MKNAQAKIFSLVGGLAAGAAASALVDLLWEKTTKQTSPSKSENLVDEPTAKVIAFAVVSGAVTAVFETLVQRKIDKRFNKIAK